MAVFLLVACSSPARSTTSPASHVPRTTAATASAIAANEAAPTATIAPSAAPAQTAEQAPSPDPAWPSEYDVPNDRRVFLAHAPRGRFGVIVYLHGVCGNPHAFEPWASAATKHGTLIAMRGDEPCKEPGRFKWGWDAAHTDRRIERAIRAIGAMRGEPLDPDNVTLVGYSQGSARAEALTARFPARYRRVVLIAGPREHDAASFRNTGRVAIVGGHLDLTAHLIDATKKAQKQGLPARYFELPGARHGDYGPDALRVMGEVLDWTSPLPSPSP